jgi:hypothetical protein
VSAEDFPIADVGDLFTATDVEGVLNELVSVPCQTFVNRMDTVPSYSSEAGSGLVVSPEEGSVIFGSGLLVTDATLEVRPFCSYGNPGGMGKYYRTNPSSTGWLGLDTYSWLGILMCGRQNIDAPNLADGDRVTGVCSPIQKYSEAELRHAWGGVHFLIRPGGVRRTVTEARIWHTFDSSNNIGMWKWQGIKTTWAWNGYATDTWYDLTEPVAFNSSAYCDVIPFTKNIDAYDGYQWSWVSGSTDNNAENPWLCEFEFKIDMPVIIDTTAMVVREDQVTSVTSILNVGGAIALPTTPIAAVSYNIDMFDSVLLVDATTGNRNVYLPDATGCRGRQYTIKHVSVDANSVTVYSLNGDIDDASSFVVGGYNRLVTVVSDGSNWFITNRV